MIPYRGKVTIEKTIKYLESMNYLIDPDDNNINKLTFKLNEEEISEILFKFYKEEIDIKELSKIVHFCEVLGISLISNENKKELNELIDLYIKNIDVFPSYEIDKLIYSFNDKNIAIEYLKYIYYNKNITSEVLVLFIEYLIKARQYYVDDRALLSSAIDLINSNNEFDLSCGHEENIKKSIEKKIINDKKTNGIYNIDEFTLEEIDRKINEFEEISIQLQNLIEITEQQISSIKEESKKSADDIVDVKISTLKTLKTEANKILKNFNTSYLELLSKQKESLVNERDILLADIETEIQKKKLELEAVATSVGQRIAIELGRIRNMSDHSIEKMQDFISNNEEVKKMFDVAKEDQAFLSRLAKMDAIPVSTSIPGVIQTGINVPSIIIPKTERVVEEKINYYFNKDVPFCDRFNELMEKKQKDIEETGAIYHEKFDDLLTIVLNNDTPYMFGPSGCGKTYMIDRQLSKLLGIDVVTNGYIMYETDIIGFNNANGIYVPSNFYRCYKYGDMIFLDELDNSMASSTIVLNSFIGKGEDSSYTFPNGDRIKRHPNFRILAAGNTRGNGRTVSHNTRQKLDEAVMQRLTPIEIDYDNRIEEKILENYPDWYNFAINFREALKSISLDDSDGPNYIGTITTRDIEAIRRYKDDKSFSDEKLLEYQVIENKDADYLNMITTNMDNLLKAGKFNEGGEELLEKFKILTKGRKY